MKPGTKAEVRRAIGSSLALLVMIAFAVLVAACGAGSNASGPRAGDTLPRATLAALDGGAAIDLAQYRGKALVVNFWATWCEPCRKEMASLETLHRKVDPERAVVLGVTVDADRNLAREFALKHGLTLTLLSDADMAYARETLHVEAFPATFLVTPEGRIAERVVGVRDWSDAQATRALKPAID